MIIEIIITSLITSLITSVVTAASFSVARRAPAKPLQLRADPPQYCQHRWTTNEGTWNCRKIMNPKCRSSLCSLHCENALCGCLEVKPEHHVIADEVRAALAGMS